MALDLGRIAVRRTGKWCVGLGLLVMGAVKRSAQANGFGMLRSFSGLPEDCCFFFAFVCLLLWGGLPQRVGGGAAAAHLGGALFLSACALALPQLIFWTFDQAKTGGFVGGVLGGASGEGGLSCSILKNPWGLQVSTALLGSCCRQKRQEFIGKYALALLHCS